MDFYVNSIVCFIVAIFPILITTLYIIYTKSLGKIEKNLCADFSIIASEYLLMLCEPRETLLISSIPLLLALFSKRKIATLSSAFILFYLSFEQFGFNVYILIIEYFLLYMLFYLYSFKKISNYVLGFLFCFIKLISFWIFVLNDKVGNLSIFNAGEIVNISFVFMISVVVFIFTYEKCMATTKLFLSLKELEENKQIKQTLFKISHEIKNPLAVCKGYLDMYDCNNEDHTRKYVPIIKSELEKTLVILQDFLSLTKTNLKLELLDVNCLIEDCLDNIELLLDSNHIDLKKELLDDEIYINGDYNRLHQVLVNVIKNAVEAMDDKDCKELYVRSYLDEKYAYIEIEDTGGGIDKDVLEDIMKPFYTTKTDGTGLGVPLSMEIINAHNGEFGFKVGSKNGTLVFIRLPREL